MTTEDNSSMVGPADEPEQAQVEQVATTEEVADTPTPQVENVEVPVKFQNPDGTPDMDKIQNSTVEALRAYKEAEAKLTRVNQAKTEPSYQIPETGNDDFQIDPDSEAVVNAILKKQGLDRNQLVAEAKDSLRTENFVKEHGEELKNDPFLDARVRTIIAQGNAEGKFVDQFDAFAQAKKEYDARFKPQVDQAKTEGVQEGQEIARAKEQSGTVGDTNTRSSVDESELSAAEFAKLHNLPRKG